MAYRRHLLFSFAAAVLFLAAVAALRPNLNPRLVETGLAPAAFNARKYASGPRFDLAVGGDSRVLRGVAPEEMEAVWSGRLRVANFSYQGTGLTEGYLHRLRGVLDPGGLRCLILSVTPYSLTRAARERNEFLQVVTEAKEGRGFWRDAVDRHFAPLNLADLLLALLRPDQINRVRSHYHSSGWVETEVQRPDEDGSSHTYRMLFEANPVERETVDGLLRFVAAATGDGIRVAGVRLPISPQLAAVEGAGAAMDWEGFVARFESAGGVWLGDFAGAAYRTYDGSHLQGADARRFSRELAAHAVARLGL